jgi:hypothetical protein|tara:strand:- start:379 stop:738 length:360 start_codon:yes stop_codon:yes gene_type:complete
MLFNDSLRKKKYKSKNENFDYKKKLIKEKKVNQDFLNRLKLLTIEEILYLKIDSISDSMRGKLLGIPIYKFLPEICKEAFVFYAFSKAKNKKDACVMLGINQSNLNSLLKKYNFDTYVE